MLRFIFFVIFLFVSPAFAQQSLFNVPSSEQTEEGRHFGQEQINLLPRNNVTSNFTYDYGVLDNVEMGFNVLDFSNLSKSEGGGSTDFMANSQVFIDLGDKWNLGVGAQLGESQEGDFAAYGFINARREIFNKDSFIVFGIFGANRAYLEAGHAAWHAGVQFSLIEDHLLFIADYINGSTSISEGVVGFGYRVTKEWMLSAGAQFPSPQSENDYGAVFELTYY